MAAKNIQNAGGVVMLGFFLAHVYCYWIWLNGGKDVMGNVNLYYVSIYAALSSVCVVIQLVAKSVTLTVCAGTCLAISNSFLLIEFLGKPEYWGVNELWLFVSTVTVSFLAAIVLNELKKKYK